MPDRTPNATSHADRSYWPPSSTRTSIWRGLLGLFVVYLMFRAWQIRSAPFVQIDWAFQNSGEFLAWLLSLVRHELIVYCLSFVLGLLVPPAIGPTLSTLDRRRRWLIRIGAWGCGLLTMALDFAIAWNELPSVGSLILPFASLLLGFWLASAALRGLRPLAWAIGQLGAILLLMLAATFAMRGMILSANPLELADTEISPAAKRQLAQRIRDSKPPEGEPRHLHLADVEINALVNSALDRGGAHRQASVHFEPATCTAQASLAMPPRLGGGAFLNVRLAGRLSIDHAHLHLDIQQLRLGGLEVPGLARWMLSSTLHAMLLDDPQIHRIIEAIIKLDTEQGAINFTFQPGALSRQVVPALVQLLWERPDVAFETEQNLRHLVAVYDTLPPQADRFGKLLQAAFEFAATKSTDHDPVLENRAAIFALAILLGHPDLEPFVGEIFDPQLRAQADKIIDTVTLRGRTDWPRHFLVSAALVLLSNESTSDRIGLMKEQLDAKQGGSGFSFADMLANFAGNRLAIAVTHDAAAARSAQTKLAHGPAVDEYFPPADEMPENLSAADLQTRYGGVGGAGYQALLDEINRRLAALPKL